MDQITDAEVPLSEERKRRREEILTAGWDVLIEHGYDGFSFANIGAKAHLARNTIYEYFPSTDALLIDVMRIQIERFHDYVAKQLVGKEAIEDIISTFVLGILEFDSQDKFRLTETIRRLPPTLPSLEEFRHRYREPVVIALQNAGAKNIELGLTLVHGINLITVRYAQEKWDEQFNQAAAEFAVNGFMALQT